MKKNFTNFIIRSDRNGRITLPKLLIEAVYPEKIHEMMAYHCPKRKVVILTPASDSRIFQDESFKKAYPDGMFRYYLPNPNGSFRFRTSLPDTEMKAYSTECCHYEIIKVTLQDA